MSAIATGVAVTGACNDHSSLPPRRRDSLAATSKITPAPSMPTGANVHGERHVHSMRRKDVGGMRTRVYSAFDPTGMWGSGAFFVRIFFHLSLFVLRLEIDRINFRYNNRF